MEASRQFRIDLVAYGVLAGISRSVGLLLLPVLTRILSPEEYGTVDITLTLAALLALLLPLSLESALMRMWHESQEVKQRTQMVSTLSFCIFLVGLLACSLIIALRVPIAKFILPEDSLEMESCLVSGTLAAFFAALNCIPKTILRMQRKILHYNLLLLSETLLYGLLAIALLQTIHPTASLVIHAFAIANLVSLILGTAWTYSFFSMNFRVDEMRAGLSYSLPMFPAVALVWINRNVDRFILLSFLGITAVSTYAVASKIAMLVGLLVAIVKQAWDPIAVSVLKKSDMRDEFYHRALNYYALLMSIFGLTIVAFNQELLYILVPAQFRTGYVMVPWLLAAIILQGSASFTNLGMLVTKKTGGNSVAAFVGAILNLLLSCALIPIAGINGAAIGSAVAAFTFTSVLCIFTRSNSGIEFDYFRLLLVCVLYSITSIILIKFSAAELNYSFSLAARMVTLVGSCLCISLGVYGSLWPRPLFGRLSVSK